MVLSEQYRNVKSCEACQLLGQASRDAGDELLLVTLSPNPEWNEYAEQLPSKQLKMLNFVHTKVEKNLISYFDGALRHLSSHYEFNRSSNLHSHCLFSIAPVMCTPADLQTLSKIYHKIIGRSYNKSSICCDVRRVTDDGIYQYLNKENIYPPKHNNINLLTYMPQKDNVAELLSSESESDSCS